MKFSNCFITGFLFAAGSVFAENLFQGDTGAEAGIEFVSGGGLIQTRVPVFHDTEVFQEGKGALRVEWNRTPPTGLRNSKPEQYFGINMPELDRDQEYTVSFYAKASEDNFPVGVHLFTRQGWLMDSSYYLKTPLTKEWKRYSFTFKPKVPKSFFSSAYSLNINLARKKNGKPVTIWFDAFQLEKGRESTAYQAPSPAAAELQLKSSAAMNIIGKGDKIEADVNALSLRDGGKLSLDVTVADWEGKVRKEFREEFAGSFRKTFELPSDRYGWFNVHLQVKSGDKVLSDLTKNYLVVRPPVKIAEGMRPFCGGIAFPEHMEDTRIFAANRAVGVARFQVRAISRSAKWNGEPRKGELDFTLTDWLVDQARKHDMVVKMSVSPFDWKDWHFTKEEVAERKRCGSRHSMLDLRHREFWKGVVSQVLDRYGDKIDTLEFGAEDNGRLGIDPYFKQKYPEGVQKDSKGTPWVVAGPAFDALCTLVTDACRMARTRYPNLRVGTIRPSQGRPGDPWFFVWKMFERIGKEFNTFPVDTYSMVPYTIGPGYSKETRYSTGGADSRPITMEHAKKMINKYGCGQDVYLSETGTELFTFFLDYSPDRLEEAEYQVQDMLAARAAGFTAYDVFHCVDEVQDGKCWSMVMKNGPQMRAGAYSAVAQILENVTESRWLKPDSVTRIALFKKIDGSGRGAVYAQPGYTMHVPEGIQVFDFMGNEYEPDAKRILPLSGAAWYFSAPKYETLVEKLENPQIEQTDYCKMAFRYVSDKAGLIRLINNSNQKSVVLECIVNVGGKEIRKNVPVKAGSWNTFRIPLDGASEKISVKCRRLGIDKNYLSEEFDLPALTPVKSGEEPVSELGVVDGREQILPNEPWTPWSGPKDLSVNLFGSWTKSALKLKAVVTDDLHHPSKDPNAPWNGDTIQIAIDPKNDGTFFKANRRDIGPDDVEFALHLNRDGQVTKAFTKNKEIKMDVRAVRDDKAGTTVYEAAIPWSELGVKPQKDMAFGLSAVIFDDDTGQGQEYRGMIGSGIAGGNKNPALYKRFVLKDGEAESAASAEQTETANLLKNPGFADQGKYWSMRYGKIQDSVREETGATVVRMDMAEYQGKGNNVLNHTVRTPEPGVYVHSVELLPSRKFKKIHSVVMYRGEDGKMVYQFAVLKPADYPKDGEWVRLVGEAQVPAGLKYMGFAVEIRDPQAEGYILIRDPQMNLREE